jgi:hypothetical protein
MTSADAPPAAPWLAGVAAAESAADRRPDVDSEGPRKRAKRQGWGVNSTDPNCPRRKRRLSWGPTGPPPKLARDSAGQPTQLTWDPPQHMMGLVAPLPKRDELALARISVEPAPAPVPAPVPVYPPLVYPSVPPVQLAVVPYDRPRCCDGPPFAPRGRAPLLLADRNTQPQIHGTPPPTFKLPWHVKHTESSVDTSDGIRACWIEEIDQDDDENASSSLLSSSSTPTLWPSQHQQQQKQQHESQQHANEVAMC